MLAKRIIAVLTFDNGSITRTKTLYKIIVIQKILLIILFLMG